MFFDKRNQINVIFVSPSHSFNNENNALIRSETTEIDFQSIFSLVIVSESSMINDLMKFFHMFLSKRKQINKANYNTNESKNT